LGKIKLSKDNPGIDVLGNLDELNSWLGICRNGLTGELSKISRDIEVIQELIFVSQTQVAYKLMGLNPKLRIDSADLKILERIIEGINKQVPEIKKFIIPGASDVSAKLDFARTLTRRAERSFVCWAKNHKGKEQELASFLNRLSSVLFALARLANHILKIKEKSPRYK
jgi:ATP:cob(I)alamin adenosyltransferase